MKSYTLRKLIYLNPSNYKWLEFDFQMPFVPYQGLTISWGGIDETITEVVYNLNKEKLFFHTKKITLPITLMSKTEVKEFGLIIRDHKEHGWVERMA